MEGGEKNIGVKAIRVGEAQLVPPIFTQRLVKRPRGNSGHCGGLLFKKVGKTVEGRPYGPSEIPGL